MRIIVSVVLTVMIASMNVILASEQSSYLIGAHSNKIKHGLHYQPDNGHFALLLSCDYTPGSMIAILPLNQKIGGPS
jgi:hypothetical protein